MRDGAGAVGVLYRAHEETRVWLVDNKPSMSERCVLVHKAGRHMLGGINKGITSGDGGVITALYSVLVRAHLEFCA